MSSNESNNTQSIRELLSRWVNTRRTLTPEQLLDQSRLPPCAENLCREVFNPGTFNNMNRREAVITFVTYHPEWHRMRFLGKDPTYWHSFKCNVGEFVFLPHGMYSKHWGFGGEIFDPLTGRLRSFGDPYRVIENYGRTMFTGNRLPAAPEVKKFKIFGGRGK